MSRQPVAPGSSTRSARGNRFDTSRSASPGVAVSLSVTQPRSAATAATSRADRRHRRVRFEPPAGDHPIWGIDPALFPQADHQLLHALIVHTASDLA